MVIPCFTHTHVDHNGHTIRQGLTCPQERGYLCQQTGVNLCQHPQDKGLTCVNIPKTGVNLCQHPQDWGTICLPRTWRRIVHKMLQSLHGYESTTIDKGTTFTSAVKQVKQVYASSITLHTSPALGRTTHIDSCVILYRHIYMFWTYVQTSVGGYSEDTRMWAISFY